jgi:hypothetical protein
MKKFITLLIGIIFLSLFAPGTVYAQWAFNGIHIYNTNPVPGNVGIGTIAPATLLEVSRNMTEPVIRVSNTGGIGGATFQMVDALSGGNWKFKVVGAGHFKIRDQIFATDPFFVEQNVPTNTLYLKSGGNIGIGTNNPLEKLQLNGAIRIGNTATTNAGTIRWDGTNFLGYNGGGWVQLDNAAIPATWVMMPNPAPGFGNSQLYPALPPGSISTSLPGTPQNLAWIHACDMPAPGLFPHQLAIESMFPAGLGASQIYQISAGPLAPIAFFSAGLFSADLSYKICNAPTLTPTSQSDGVSMLRANPGGIVDLPNQSRVRAYQFSAAGLVQAVLPSVWTPVNFNFETPMPVGWDEQSEFTLAPAPNTPTPFENSFFIATQEGYYQVNARCQFELPTGPGALGPGSYVSIAIWTGAGPGGSASYAIGNDLSITYLNAGLYYPLTNNGAPNVSDVVYLLPGQIISIWVWQSALIPLNLMQGSNACYVSIHKVS